MLPSKLPNLLVNGSGGIAVGMATNIPPHNLNEVVDACLHMLRNPGASIDELMEIIPAPDFPTAGIIYGINGVKDGYRTGRGKVVMRAKCHFEDIDKGQRQAIIVDELPYQVNKKTLQERMAELVHEKKIEGISHIQDESDKSGMRLVIELKRGEVPEVVLNNLYKQTQLQDTFGINMVALINGQPKLCNLKDLIEVFLNHRREVVTRRTVFNLRKARERGHVLEGLAVALANIDDFIAIIRNAPTPPVAKVELMNRPWDSQLVREMLTRTRADGGVINADDYRPDGLERNYGMGKDGLYRLSDTQAQEILQMRLQRLTGLEQDKIVAEYKEVMAEIEDLLDILAKPERVSAIIGDELGTIRHEFGQSKLGVRRSHIEHSSFDLSTEDLITPTDMVVTLSHSGYIKSQPLSEYRAQKRGVRGMMLDESQSVIAMLVAEDEQQSVLTATENGFGKRTNIAEYTRHGRGTKGMIAIQQSERNGKVVAATLAHADDEIMLITDKGVLVRTRVSEIREMGRATQGVRLMALDEGAKLSGLQRIVENDANAADTSDPDAAGDAGPADGGAA